MVLVERFLAGDHVPASGSRGQEGVRVPGLRQPHHHGVAVAHHGLFDGEHPQADQIGRGKDDAVEGRLHVLGAQIRSVVELDAFPQVEGVGHPIRGDVPAYRQARDDGELRIARVLPDQQVVHGGLGAHVGDRPGRVDIEHRGRTVRRQAQRAAPLGLVMVDRFHIEGLARFRRHGWPAGRRCHGTVRNGEGQEQNHDKAENA